MQVNYKVEFASMLGFIERRDHGLMRRVNRWSAPRWIRLWMVAATRGGDGWLWYASLIAVMIFGGSPRFFAAGAAALSVAIGIGLFIWLKRFTGRKRPCHIEPHCWATLLPPDQFSFPSGHTITAFAMASSLATFYPEIAPVLYFCSISIAASRILLGMHFLSDVAVGAGLGYWLGANVASFFL